MEGKRAFSTIDEYIKGFPADIQAILESIRQTIKEAAPGSREIISYRMPGFKLNNRTLVWFAAFKDHIGFFPTGSGVEAFKDELQGYKISKGTIQFPLDKPIPFDLIGKIVNYRANYFDRLTGKKLAIIAVGEDAKGETEAAVFTGTARWHDGHVLLDRENEQSFQLPDDTLERIKPTPAKVSKIVLGAKFYVTMSIGPIPEGENPEDYIKTGLKWPKELS
jgi:uncharacterized protein YdhG (YjbR/CyaY superfamily)